MQQHWMFTCRKGGPIKQPLCNVPHARALRLRCTNLSPPPPKLLRRDATAPSLPCREPRYMGQIVGELYPSCSLSTGLTHAEALRDELPRRTKRKRLARAREGELSRRARSSSRELHHRMHELPTKSGGRKKTEVSFKLQRRAPRRAAHLCPVPSSTVRGFPIAPTDEERNSNRPKVP